MLYVNCLLQCDARFGAKETLNRHMYTHQSTKPYTCIECGKGFIQLSQLKTHMAQHPQSESILASDDIYCCALCDRYYKQRWRLQYHYRIEHNEHKELAEVSDTSAGKCVIYNRTDRIIFNNDFSLSQWQNTIATFAARASL